MTNIERIAAEVFGAILLCIGITFYLEHRGAKACVMADKAAIVKQEHDNARQEAKDTQTVQKEEAVHAAAVAQPPDPTPALECVRVTKTYVVSKAAAARPAGDAPAIDPVGYRADPVRSFDPGPKLAKVGQRADAQIAELQDYIKNVCLK